MPCRSQKNAATLLPQLRHQPLPPLGKFGQREGQVCPVEKGLGMRHKLLLTSAIQLHGKFY